MMPCRHREDMLRGKGPVEDRCLDTIFSMIYICYEELITIAGSSFCKTRTIEYS